MSDEEEGATTLIPLFNRLAASAADAVIEHGGEEAEGDGSTPG